MLIARLISFVKEAVVDVARIFTTKGGLKGLYGVSLYRNAIYLMVNSVLLVLTGFFFWMAAARLYPVEAVGLTSAAIAAIGLLTLLSTLGLDYGLIRFLPGSGEKARDMINSCFTVGGLISIALAFIFLAGLVLFIRNRRHKKKESPGIWKTSQNFGPLLLDDTPVYYPPPPTPEEVKLLNILEDENL